MAKTTSADLQKELSGLNSEYQAMDDAALQAQAEQLYNPIYEQNKQDLASSLANQLNAVDGEVYDFGMQRSSYNPSVRASLRGGYQRAQTQMDLGHQGSMASVLQNMRDTEYQRKNAADQYRNNLLLQLYQIDHPGSSGGGGGGGSPNNNKTNDTDDLKQDNYVKDVLLDGLGNRYAISPNQGEIYKNGKAVQLTWQNGNWVSKDGSIPQKVINYATGLPLDATPTAKTTPVISAAATKAAEQKLTSALSTTTKKTVVATKK